MADRLIARVKPDLLRWAREAAGLSIDVAAKKIGTSSARLADWERGDRSPTVVQLRKAANVYRRPLAVFFLPEAPPTPQPLHDFRRVAGEVSGSLSPELVLEIRRARRRRSVALELLAESGPVPATSILTTALDQDPEMVAARTREWLGVSLDEQARWQGFYAPLNACVSRLEALGILVFQTGDVPLPEMRGFSISESTLPVIVLNAKDAPRPRTFTLMHELTHLMLAGGGVCDPQRVSLRASATAPLDERTEVFCNRTAGAVLVPREVLLSHPQVRNVHGRRDWSEQAIREMANHFGVSREVIVRRLLILERTTERFYEEKRNVYRAEWAKRQASETDVIVPIPRLVVRDNGRRYTRLVLEALEREQITPADVTDFLNVRLKHLEQLEDAVGARPTGT
jgi:Zn-dependent peptidase ImmA (M78 family)/transcriptional regulator with XRE-family HTH domain